MSDINVVPYIDVMLVLLVIFMVTAPLLTQGVKVDVPKADAAPLDADKDEPLIVSIKADGSLYINIGEDQEKARPLGEIKNTVSKIVKNKPATTVFIWGDEKIPYGRVVSLMSELQKSGVSKVGLVTEPAK